MLRMDFWSRFHRRFHFSINPQGIHFDYRGDEVTWIYPWKRSKPKRKYYSIGFSGTFSSLRQIDEEWDSYFRAMSAVPYKKTTCSKCKNETNFYGGTFVDGEPVCPVCSYGDKELYDIYKENA